MFAVSGLTRYPRLGRHWDREEERCLGEVEAVGKESLCGTGHQFCAPRGPFESFSLQELLTASSECREALSEVAYGTSKGGLWWGSANSFLLNLGRCSCLENPHGQRSLVGYSPWSHKESDMTEATELNRCCVNLHYMFACYRGSKGASSKCSTCAKGLFWAKGNWDLVNAREITVPPLTT